MRSTKKDFRPRLEVLEERWVPATVKDVAGVLLISNPTATGANHLVVTVQGTPGQVSVKDGTASAVIYSGVGSLISITGANLTDTVDFTGNAGGFTGNLLLNAGNGNDVVNLSGPVGGNVTVLTGFGVDTVNLGAASAFAVGGTFTYHDALGNDTVATAANNFSVGGPASLTGLQNFNIAGAGNVSVGGSLTMTNISAGFPLNVNASGAGSLTVGSTSGPLQALTVNATNGGNKFVMTAGALSVSGNASFSLGNGNNTFNLSNTSASTIGGNLYYQGGAGTNSATIGTLMTVNGNATLNMGDGAATLGLSTTGWTVAGNLTINEGNGNNTLFTVGGTVAGNETITQGNGVNGLVTVGNATNGGPAGYFTYKSGNGTDSLTLTGPAAGAVYNVSITYGTNPAAASYTLTLAAQDTVSGTVTGNGGGNVFTQNGATLVNVNFVNFP